MTPVTLPSSADNSALNSARQTSANRHADTSAALASVAAQTVTQNTQTQQAQQQSAANSGNAFGPNRFASPRFSALQSPNQRPIPGHSHSPHSRPPSAQTSFNAGTAAGGSGLPPSHAPSRSATTGKSLIGSPALQPYTVKTLTSIQPQTAQQRHSAQQQQHQRQHSNQMLQRQNSSNASPHMSGQMSNSLDASRNGSVTTAYDVIFSTIKSLVRLLESYFSNSSLWSNSHLLAQMNTNELNFVSLAFIMDNNAKIREVSGGDLQVLLAAIKQSNKLQLTDDCTACRRLTPLPFYDDHTADAQRSIYVENLPQGSTVKSTKQLFKRFGKVTFVLRANEEGQVSSTDVDETFDSAFVQFEKIPFANRALHAIIEYQSQNKPKLHKTQGSSAFDGDIHGDVSDDDEGAESAESAPRASRVQSADQAKSRLSGPSRSVVLKANSPEFVPLQRTQSSSVSSASGLPLTEDANLGPEFLVMSVEPKTEWLARIKRVVTQHFKAEDEQVRRSISAQRQSMNWRDGKGANSATAEQTAAVLGFQPMSPLVRAIAMKSPSLAHAVAAADVASLQALASPPIYAVPSPHSMQQQQQQQNSVGNSIIQTSGGVNAGMSNFSPCHRSQRTTSVNSNASDGFELGSAAEGESSAQGGKKRRANKPKQSLMQQESQLQQPHQTGATRPSILASVNGSANGNSSTGASTAAASGASVGGDQLASPSMRPSVKPFSARPNLAKQQSINAASTGAASGAASSGNNVASRFASGPTSDQAKGFSRVRTASSQSPSPQMAQQQPQQTAATVAAH